MATELTLPDMGDGIEDVTINRWLVAEGDDVNEGDIIVEVATDKVDTEIPASASGKLLAIHAKEGALIPLSAALGVVGAEGETVSDSGGTPAPEAAPAPAVQEPVVASSNGSNNAGNQSTGNQSTGNQNDEVKATPVAKRIAVEKGIVLSQIAGSGPNGQITKQDVLDHENGGAPIGGSGGSTPGGLPGELADVPSMVVRRAAAENGINLDDVANGRPLSTLTKYDILSAAASKEAGQSVTVEPRFQPPVGWTPAAAPATSSAQPAAATSPAATSSPAASAPAVGPAEELVKPNRMRQLIAKNTLESQRIAPQLTTMWDVDMSTVLAHRKANKAAFATEGVKLTVTAYLMMAAVAGLKAVPAANASWTDEGIVIKRYYNVGMAVALPVDRNGIGGLIVPVIKDAGDLNLLGMARAINTFAAKARDGSLGAADLQGGTFTVSNYGTSGSRFQTPIINQPQVGILGVGVTEKRAVVVSNGHPLEANAGDYLTFKPMTTLGFTYDHRVLDGATADAYCAAVKNALESWA